LAPDSGESLLRRRTGAKTLKDRKEKYANLGRACGLQMAASLDDDLPMEQRHVRKQAMTEAMRLAWGVLRGAGWNAASR